VIEVKDEIEPNFELQVDGFVFLGRGSTCVDGTPGWKRDSRLFYRCVTCGTFMQASTNDYFNCDCKAMSLDIDAGRFGSRYGDINILVYKVIERPSDVKYKCLKKIIRKFYQ
jgi:hypothetical protein